MSTSLSVSAGIECLAFVAAILSPHGRRKPLLYLTLFLAYTSVNEQAAHSWCNLLGHTSNYGFYTIYFPLSLLFYGGFIRHAIKGAVYRRICEAMIIAGVSFAIANALWGQGLAAFNNYTFTAVILLMIAMVLLRFYDLVANDGAYVSDAEPYILAGLLVFHSCALVTIALHPSIKASGMHWNGIKLYTIIFWLINALQYGLFIIGFLKCRVINSKTPSSSSS